MCRHCGGKGCTFCDELYRRTYSRVSQENREWDKRSSRFKSHYDTLIGVDVSSVAAPPGNIAQATQGPTLVQGVVGEPQNFFQVGKRVPNLFRPEGVPRDVFPTTPKKVGPSLLQTQTNLEMESQARLRGVNPQTGRPLTPGEKGVLKRQRKTQTQKLMENSKSMGRNAPKFDPNLYDYKD